MRRVRFIAFATAFFPLMVIVNSWLFRKWFGTSYLDWYIANGTFISVTASLFAVVWKNLNDNPGLIAANPTVFLAANLQLIGIQAQVIGQQLTEGVAKLKSNRRLSASLDTGVPFSDLFDGAASLVAALVMVSALTVWFVTVVPLQYFIVLLAGAPARLALKLNGGAIAAVDQTVIGPLALNEIEKWERNLLTALAGKFPSDPPGETFDLASLQLPREVPLSLPSQLVDQRPDIRAAEAQLYAASAGIGVAIAARLPQITLSANPGLMATTFGQLFTPGAAFWSAGGSAPVLFATLTGHPALAATDFVIT